MKRTLTGYLSMPGQEKKKVLEKGFARLAEYEYFYLYGKIKDDKVLYRECFSKFDIDGVKAKAVERGPVCGKTHRGEF